MIKKTITYIDYKGNERTEDFYFNLNKAEAMKLELSTKGGLSKMIEDIVAAEDTPTIIKVFEDMICKSYGVRSDDGKRFIKDDAKLQEFKQTEAYSQLFMELATDTKAAIDFFNQVVPIAEPKPNQNI